MRYLSVILFTLFSFSLFSQTIHIPEPSKDLNSVESLYSIVTNYVIEDGDREITLDISSFIDRFEKIESVLSDPSNNFDFRLEEKRELILIVPRAETTLKDVLYNLFWINDLRLN